MAAARETPAADEPPKKKKKEKNMAESPRFPIGVCHICGDNGANYHYNGYACQSCRVFFTRSLLRGKPFTCQNRNRCDITKATRTDCPACRFQKCIKANMASNEVGRYKRQGGAVVPYRIGTKMNTEIKKYGRRASLGFSYIKELDDVYPASRYADVLISLEKMCANGPRVPLCDLHVNIDVSLEDVLQYSQASSPRTAINWDDPFVVNDMTPFLYTHYCRSATFLSDFLTAVPEMYKLCLSDRLKLARHNLIDFTLITIQYHMWEAEIHGGWLFLNGIHFIPPKVSKDNPGLTNLIIDVIKYMEDHVRTVFEELEIMEQEYLLLKMIILFHMPPDISDEGREVIRQGHVRYCRILMELFKERLKHCPSAELLSRLSKFMSVIPYIKTTSQKIAQACSSLVLANVGGLRGSLTYDLHFRNF